MGAFSNPEGYELWMGRWSARLAPTFVKFTDLAGQEHVLDVGSGTGALAQALLSIHGAISVTGIEPAEDYVAYSRSRIDNFQAVFTPGDALNIPFADESFDATLSLLILQELPDAPKALAEMRRVTRPGGLVAASQWNFKTGMPMLSLFWNAVIDIVANNDARRAAARTLDVDYPDANALKDLWKNAGLEEIVTELHVIDMHFKSFEDYWTPFLSGVTETSSYAEKLNQRERAAVKERLRQKIREQSNDESFTLKAEAWAVKGSVPISH